MKQLVLTGMATEHVFMNGGGVEAYFLIFNGGEVRIPVPQETAEAVIKELYGSSEGETEEPTGFTQEDYNREREALREEMAKETQSTHWAGDDDGIDQI